MESAAKYASNFHKNEISHFYNGSGKELPSQLLMRIMKNNENYWKDPKSDKYIRPKLDFSLMLMKNNIK